MSNYNTNPNYNGEERVEALYMRKPSQDRGLHQTPNGDLECTEIKITVFKSHTRKLKVIVISQNRRNNCTYDISLERLNLNEDGKFTQLWSTFGILIEDGTSVEQRPAM